MFCVNMKLRLFRKEERNILDVYNETLRRIFRPSEWGYRKVHNEQFHGSHSSVIAVTANTQRRINW
jgi:hypothetical protein